MGISRIDTLIGVNIRDLNRNFFAPDSELAGPELVGTVDFLLTLLAPPALISDGLPMCSLVGDNGLPFESTTVMQRGLSGLSGLTTVAD